jgi:hypothetical protein
MEEIDHHQATNVPVLLVTCGAYAVTKNHGPVILFFHQLTGIQKGQSILLSAGQVEAFHNKVKEWLLCFDPLITTKNDSFELSLNVQNGQAYLDPCTPT